MEPHPRICLASSLSSDRGHTRWLRGLAVKSSGSKHLLKCWVTSTINPHCTLMSYSVESMLIVSAMFRSWSRAVSTPFWWLLFAVNIISTNCVYVVRPWNRILAFALSARSAPTVATRGGFVGLR